MGVWRAYGPENYATVIHADERPAADHVRRHSGTSALKVAGIVPRSEDDKAR